MADKKEEEKPGKYMSILREVNEGLSELLKDVETGNSDPSKITERFVDIASNYVGGNKTRLSAILGSLTKDLFSAVIGYNAEIERSNGIPRTLQKRAKALGELEQSFQNLNLMFTAGIARDVATEIGYTPEDDALVVAVYNALAESYKK